MTEQPSCFFGLHSKGSITEHVSLSHSYLYEADCAHRTSERAGLTPDFKGRTWLLVPRCSKLGTKTEKGECISPVFSGPFAGIPTAGIPAAS